MRWRFETDDFDHEQEYYNIVRQEYEQDRDYESKEEWAIPEGDEMDYSGDEWEYSNGEPF